ncbi:MULTISPECIES: LysR family transcriptional regulator [Betaproteobacteria]|uniref:LysR family transcriptional regulator n=2 Tax=Betaproteobacteria TaxID=28216 RepID=N6XVH6_THASP|nr:MULTISPECIES: LysR family transcriptional regulator [Betaproteobacteria]AIA99102.1 CysJI operon transcriptional activator [Methylibium sp. T29]ENO85781.1 LysR family transcriptional regulator [Thauera aminoaromatica S2]KIN88466.1 bacterial regulatory helix-turn-helix, lysR family protein [Thauera sp. SWB20]KQW36796.1 transcriptional regulator [Rhizobacter sp. Root404]KQW76482.1 transcriptional regulator [Methylibium sp. Root1272]
MDVLRLTLRQLQIFVAVARSGSTTAASAEIALSQSATSSAVNELERLLSLRLFDRAGKRLLLNDNGRALLPRALALLDGAAGIEQMSRDGSAQAQSLRIGASTTIGNYVLPKLLAGFMGAQQPGSAAAWRSKVVIGNTAAICDAVTAFELDVGLIEGPSHQPELVVTPWLQDEMVVVAAPDSALARSSTAGERIPLRTLREAVWLVRETGSGTREATDQSLLPHLRSYRRSIELGSSEAIQRAAQEGLGVACLSAWVVNDALEAGRLCRVSTTLPRQLRQCHLVVHREKQSTPALLAFIAQADATAGAAR